MITVYLEDGGQDFLEWDIEDGVVVDCRPFQAWLWIGTRVYNEEIKPGDFLTISKLPDTSPTKLRYLVKEVQEIKQEVTKPRSDPVQKP